MAQKDVATRKWLVALACIGVLAVVTAIASRMAATVAPVATPRVDAPPAAPPASPSAVVAAAPASRDASWREAREAAIRVQQRLRAEQLARKAAQAQEGAARNERCVNGQRMKRVENGWVQAGNC